MGGSVSKASESRGISAPADGNDEENPILEKKMTVDYFVSDKQGETFAQLIKDNTQYGKMFEASLLFEIHINKKGLHWYLLFKLETSEFPFVTFEIVTNDGKTSSALVCVQDDDTGKEPCPEPCGSVNTTMKELCNIADTTRNQMKRYDLIERNCQHFCNAVLSSLPCFSSFETTCGPQFPTGEYAVDNDGGRVQFDDTTIVLKSLNNRLPCNNP